MTDAEEAAALAARLLISNITIGAYLDGIYTTVESAGGSYITDTAVGTQYGCHIGNKTAVSLGRFKTDHF
jgi:hypothetical protein